MFPYQFRMSCYVTRVEVRNSQVKQDIEDICDVENAKIEAVHLCSHGILHADFDAEEPERLHEQVGQQYPEQSGKQSLFHLLSLLLVCVSVYFPNLLKIPVCTYVKGLLVDKHLFGLLATVHIAGTPFPVGILVNNDTHAVFGRF